jgi:hypothetical protein
MSPDPYPEVSGDESGIVPPQSSTRSSEWPKKLRTLTAAELDRLTIDNTGRFYWDGKLVNYDTQPKQLTNKSSDSLDRSMDMLDRAGSEFGGNKSPATIEGELSRLDTLSRESRPSELDISRPHVVETSAATHEIGGSDERRLTLSGWQTAGAVIAVICIVVGAFGMATYGYVAAREWGCKTGAFQNGCPVKAEPPARADIPA